MTTRFEKLAWKVRNVSLAIGLAGSLIAGSGIGHAQTILGRYLLSDGKGDNRNPKIAAAGTGRYVVTWDKYLSLDDVHDLRGRVIKTDGKTVTDIRQRVLPAVRNEGHWLTEIGGTKKVMEVVKRESDGKWITAVFDSAMKKPLGKLQPFDLWLWGWGGSWFAPSADGVVLVHEQSGYSHLRTFSASGALQPNDQRLYSSNAAKYSFIHESLAVDANGFCVIGREYTSSKERPSAVYVPDSLVVPAKGVALTGFYKDVDWVRASFEGSTGLLVFYDDNSDRWLTRQINAGGQPTGPITKLNVDMGWVESLELLPLTGKQQYLLVWGDDGDDVVYAQILSSSGALQGTPVPLASVYDAEVTMRMDAVTGRLLLAHQLDRDIYVTVVQFD